MTARRLRRSEAFERVYYRDGMERKHRELDSTTALFHAKTTTDRDSVAVNKFIPISNDSNEFQPSCAVTRERFA